MIAKKQMRDGEMVDEAEAGNAGEAAQPEKEQSEGQKAVGPPPKAEVAAKAEVKVPDAPRKPEPAKAEAKPQIDLKAQAQAKPKPKAEEAAVAAKPAEPKSLAEVMKFDLRAKRRRRY